ncbi:tetratricopeptide repeat protein [Winogradskya humida]|uniref:Tetratricopeptide repeat protein n=1 Tax=Winogradskya humida TaxID=113566 RepID=A0ABQ3ZLU3_9ACTN|nr:hypothetical protein [Actinoplanes humidus]GIE19528.1 hypothetical protein Ahu01nite_026300 [Actinoplanes humidus]
MDADESRPAIRRGRPVERVVLPAGPARDLAEVLYRLYAEADCPRLDDLVETIAADDSLPGAPKKDLISKILSGEGLGTQQDTVTVAVAMAHAAGRGDTEKLAEKVRQLWIDARTAPASLPLARLGRAVAACDPLALEVHPTIQAHGLGQHPGLLPAYVPRTHDARLRNVADEVIQGSSRMVTLVGGSSTGKTRAAWELTQYLDRRTPNQWRLWHPYDPTRSSAVESVLDQVGPYTIVWLNEAQHYLMPAVPELGERVAAGLRTVLNDPSCGPVLILATLWPQYWQMLASRPDPGQPDPFAQARDLLTATAVIVSDRFTPEELAGLVEEGTDPRVRQAAARAENGRVTQYLAGAPELEVRYRTAPAAARAVIRAAMDARRLGHPLALPHALLARAVPGYLDDQDWDALGEGWLEQALAYCAEPCKGARGPLTRVRSRLGIGPLERGQQLYRLADYLEQTGSIERVAVYPPDTLWAAFNSTITDTGLLRALARQAEERGRYQHAVNLYRNAAERGDVHAFHALGVRRERSGDPIGADEQVLPAIDHRVPRTPQTESLPREQHADRIVIAAPYSHETTAAVVQALVREQHGDPVGAETLAIKAADRGNPNGLQILALRREQNGNLASAEALVVQAADRGDTEALRTLALRRLQNGHLAGAEKLLLQAVNRGDARALLALAQLREHDRDAVNGERLRRFGLTGAGTPAWSLDFSAG